MKYLRAPNFHSECPKPGPTQNACLFEVAPKRKGRPGRRDSKSQGRGRRAPGHASPAGAENRCALRQRSQSSPSRGDTPDRPERNGRRHYHKKPPNQPRGRRSGFCARREIRGAWRAQAVRIATTGNRCSGRGIRQRAGSSLLPALCHSFTSAPRETQFQKVRQRRADDASGASTHRTDRRKGGQGRRSLALCGRPNPHLCRDDRARTEGESP